MRKKKEEHKKIKKKKTQTHLDHQPLVKPLHKQTLITLINKTKKNTDYKVKIEKENT